MNNLFDSSGKNAMELSDIAKHTPNIYNAKEYGAKGDNSTNDQPALQELVNLVSTNGGGIIYLPKGIYILNSTLTWKSKVSLVGSGIGKSILKNVGTQFSIITGLDVTKTNPYLECNFMNFEIDGSGMLDTEYFIGTKGIFLQYMRRCIFRDLYIHDTWATGLGTDFLDQCVIDNVTTYNCGRGWVTGSGGAAGIGIGTGGLDIEHNIITNCHAYNNGLWGIFLECQGTPIPVPSSFIISNCIVKNGRKTGIGIVGTNDVILSDCISTDNVGGGIKIDRGSKNIQINNCISTYNVEAGLSINGGGENIKVADCNISNNVSSGIVAYLNTGITLKQVTINACTCESNGIGAINISGVGTLSTMDVTNNHILKNTADAVFIDFGSGAMSDINISSNKITLNTLDGIYIKGASAKDVKINNNTINNNGTALTSLYRNGIRPVGSFNGIQIVNNNCFDNQASKTQQYGIWQPSTSVFDYGRIEMNDCRRNVTAGTQIDGTNTNTTVANNL